MLILDFFTMGQWKYIAIWLPGHNVPEWKIKQKRQRLWQKMMQYKKQFRKKLS